VKALILDDSHEDAELLILELRRSGLKLNWRHAATKAEYCALLDWPPDVVLADYSLPGFSAPDALDLLVERGLDIPFIVISGSIGEDLAVNILKRGAADYLLKDRLARVGLAIQRAVDERQQRLLTREAEERLRVSEERTRFALQASRVGVWEADLRTGQSSWSDVCEALHGLQPGSFGGNFEAFLDRIHPGDRGDVTDAIARAMRERTDSTFLYRTTWPDGSLHWIRSRGRTFYDETGQPARSAGVSYDVTENLALEAQYRQAQKMEAVGQLAGGVAHDFNNLLTVIQGYGNMIMERPDHPDAVELQMILQAAERATSLTRQLLAFSRRQILELSVFDLRETIERMVPMMRRLIGEHLEVVVATPAEPCRVKADDSQIEQVILNLAVNARDAMPSGGKLTFETAEVTLDESYTRHRHDATPGEYIMLAVSDTGTGIDPSALEHIFEPFFTTKGKDKGTGLGLATVYGIVKQCNGHIDVYSELGRGTTFKVYLPRVGADEVQAEARPLQPDTTQGSETILVVEDDEAVRALISNVLERRGYHALMAATPGEALGIYQAHAGTGVDLLLTDVVMPEMSGRELATKLAQVNGQVRVLYMSGYTDAAIVQHGMLDDGTAFIQKPFTPDSLSRKLREVLGQTTH
jgi:two-component system, cell cycle sensor histidine kinase and response regulator CckA